MNKGSLKEKALNLLARREHSRKELQFKLLQRGFSLSAIEAELNILENENLLNEGRFIDAFIRTRRSHGMGPLKICVELQKRGIDRNRILSSEEWQEILWQASAIAVRIKRFGEHLPRDTDDLRQQAQFLQGRGFTTDQIRVALKRQFD